MTDIRQTVDELRFLLQREAIEQSAELERLLTGYAAACHEANRRLRQCEECLKQGLRSEALHLAEASPNLLDYVALLDFPERGLLDEVVGIYSLPPPEPLLLEVASALNEAYAAQQPLQKLLDAHRWHALARSPLSKRLTILRALAQQDPQTPHWEDDIREWERARLRELESAAQAALVRKDLETLQDLVNEAQSKEWKVPVPAALLQKLKSRLQQLQREQAREKISQLNEELHAAFSALDADRARTLRQEWWKQQKLAQLEDDDALAEAVAPVFGWLSDLDRELEAEREYQQIVTSIEQALEQDKTTAAELRKFLTSLERLQRGLPTALENRLRNRLAALEASATRRRRLLLASGIAAAFLLVAAILLIVHQRSVAEETRRLVAAVEGLIEQHRFEEARQLLDSNRQQARTSEWLAVQRKLLDAEQKERDRQIQFRAELDKVREADPQNVETALSRAWELVRTTEEKLELEKLQSAWEQRKTREATEREQQFRQSLTAAQRALDALDGAISQGVKEEAALTSLMDAAKERVAALRNRQGIASEFVSQALLLESRLKATQQAIADSKRKVELLDKLTETTLILPNDSAPIIAKYEALLKDYAAAFPKDPRSEQFLAAAAASPLPAQQRIQQLRMRWKRIYPAHEKDIDTRIAEVQSYLAEFPESPDRLLLQQYETWLVSMQRRFHDDGDPEEGALRKLSRLFNNKFVSQTYTLKSKEGHIYYCTEPHDGNWGSRASFLYYIGFNGETRRAAMPPENLVFPRTEPAPQQALAERVRNSLHDLKLETWNSYFHELAQAILKAQAVDPFLRYLLLFRTLEYAATGDAFLGQELLPVYKRLYDRDLDLSVPWFDPLSKSASKARQRAIELLAAVPPLEPVFTQAVRKIEEFERELFRSRFAVGWLDKDEQGKWICRSRWSPRPQHTLCVVTSADSHGVRSWRTIGQVESGELIINPIYVVDVTAGAVVFAAPALEGSTGETAPTP